MSEISTIPLLLAPAVADEPSDAGDDPSSPPPGAETGCRVQLSLETDDCEPPLTGWLDVQLTRITALAGVSAGELGVTVVGDDRMASLHQQYKDVTGTTDVLTFDLREDVDEPIEGDIVVCLDEARRQAGDHGHGVREETLLYAVHGLLHLLGEDDHDEAAAARMHRREDELLERAGIGRVYDPKP